MKKKVILMIALTFSFEVFGWGKTGHRIVGEIADSYLKPKTQRKVEELIGPQSLAQVSVWPDFIKSDPKEWGHTFKWHYVNPIEGSEMKLPKGKHILVAIEELTKTLGDKKASKTDRANALKFLVHLIGDLHQPLHVGKKSDRGGNDFDVKWFGKATNLHAVWDESLIDFQELSYTEYTKFINHPNPKEIKKWTGSEPLAWAQESRDLRENIYKKTKANSDLRYEYNYLFITSLNQRLLQGGVRLAGLLNKTLGK